MWQSLILVLDKWEKDFGILSYLPLYMLIYLPLQIFYFIKKIIEFFQCASVIDMIIDQILSEYI